MQNFNDIIMHRVSFHCFFFWLERIGYFCFFLLQFLIPKKSKTSILIHIRKKNQANKQTKKTKQNSSTIYGLSINNICAANLNFVGFGNNNNNKKEQQKKRAQKKLFQMSGCTCNCQRENFFSLSNQNKKKHQPKHH